MEETVSGEKSEFSLKDLSVTEEVPLWSRK
jgi:hypothetical protein